MRTSVIATAFLAACAQAIRITSPPKGETLDLSEGFKVTFDTVNSDPSSAHIFIVQMSGGNTPFSKDLGKVDLTKGFFMVEEDDIAAGNSYQFNIQSIDKENTGILAQSEQFEVKAAEKEESSKSSSSASEYATTNSASSTRSTSSLSKSSMTSVSSSADASASSDSDSSSSTATSASVSGSATASPTKNNDANASSTGVPDSAAPSVIASGSLLALAVAGLVAVMA